MNIMDVLKKKILLFEDIYPESLQVCGTPIYKMIEGMKCIIGFEYSIKYKVYNEGIEESVIEEVENDEY